MSSVEFASGLGDPKELYFDCPSEVDFVSREFRERIVGWSFDGPQEQHGLRVFLTVHLILIHGFNKYQIRSE